MLDFTKKNFKELKENMFKELMDDAMTHQIRVSMSTTLIVAMVSLCLYISNSAHEIYAVLCISIMPQ